MSTVLVTGGAGFIGSAVVRELLDAGHGVVNLDALTYAGNRASLNEVHNHPGHTFVEGDIRDGNLARGLLDEHDVDAVMHLAAESHVDRSIDAPGEFIETNVVGTMRLLDASLDYQRSLPDERAEAFRFHHVSTDEVFGDLPFDSGIFTEDTPYDPSSPYSASKAASDHLVRAWHRTFGLPVVLSNCSNNYGPRQFPEKLIPVVILNALEERPLPIYGEGRNVRDWLHVDDHARALRLVLEAGRPGRSYNVGGRAERTNLDVVHAVCDVLDRLRPRANGTYRELITHVRDRPGHDRRYAIDPSRIENELGWRARETFESGIENTVRWYLDNREWWEPLVAAARQRRGQG